MKVSISPGNSKTGRIPSVSLPPGATCTAEARRSCFKEGCYAVKLARIYPNVRKAWQGNLDIFHANREAYFSGIEEYLRKHSPRYFRWHVSGDFPTFGYALRVVGIAKKFPAIRFLAFTKTNWLLNKPMPENLSIVFSAWPGNPVPAGSFPFPIAYLSEDPACPQDARHCPGNCETCGMCWSLRQGESVCFDKH